MKILSANLILNDQYGISEDIIIGVFSDDTLLNKAKENASEEFSKRRPIFKTAEIEVNVYLCNNLERSL